MGNCVSSQGQSSALEKQAAAARSSNILSSRKAAMEKYPVPTKCRLAAATEDVGNNATTQQSSGDEKKDSSPTVSSTTTTTTTQLRSKLRPPSVSLARPVSIPSSKSGIDSNGNIPRPSSLPRLLKNEAPVAASVASSAGKPPPVAGVTKRTPAAARTASLDCKNRTVLNQSTSSSASSDSNKSAPSPKDSQIGSMSPSLSMLSVTSSLGSNKSNSVADSGIASSSQRSPTLAEKKSALSLKFGFYSQKKAAGVAEMKKAAVDRFNSAAASVAPASSSSTSQARTAVLAAPFYSKSRIQQHQQQQPRLIGAQRPSYRLAGRQLSAETTTSKVLPTPQLALIKDRAAQVLSRSRSSEYKPIEPRPRLSVEAIVASLEQEVRHQLGPELPPLPPIERRADECATKAKSVELDIEQQLRQHLQVERFGLEPGKAEMTYVESGSDEHDDDDDEDLIEDIELQLQTPSSAADHQASPDGDGRSHHGDEEDSAATSISDAMIDDEIADQPGLVMLGQSASVPASPSHSWRTELFEYTLPPMSVIPYPPPADEDSSESSAGAYHRLVRRRVASVSHIDAGLKESVAGSDSAVVTGSSSPADCRAEYAEEDEANMRTDLFNSSSAPRSGIWTHQSDSTILIDLDEYTAMANELADIKAQLVTLQNLLVDAATDVANVDDAGQQSAPLWDLKRDLVLLREELLEKNTTIKSLKNELKAAAGRSVTKTKESCKSTTCNVATQTDRPRNGTIGNGLSPSDSNEDGQLVSIKKKLVVPSGLPVRSRPLPVKTK